MAETEMVERVAIALHDCYARQEMDWGVFARAAIEAMRAPHVAMIEAGKALAVETPPHDKTGEVTAFHVWTAMVDAALSPPSKV